MHLLLVILIAILLAHLDQRRDRIVARWCVTICESSLLPVMLGLLSAVSVAVVWGSLDAPGGIHDERAYLVQARLFAGFRWTAPTPPVPIAWEMPHVFLEPAIFSKYPPGHSLLLVPGVWIGAPALIPIILTGLAGTMLFLLIRQHAGTLAGLVGWLLWTTSPTMLVWHATYMSQTSTVVLWLVALFALSKWWHSLKWFMLCLSFAALSIMVITRPVPGVVLAVLVGAVVVMRSARERQLKTFFIAMVVGATVCTVIPVWAWLSTGSPLDIPYLSYSRYYFPFDLPGFQLDSSPPLRTLPPDMKRLGVLTRLLYDGHAPQVMFHNFITRSQKVFEVALSSDVAPLLVFLPFGIVALGRAIGSFAVSVFVVHVAGYLVMPHHPNWTIYYLELFPLVAAVVAVGCVYALRRISRVRVGPRWMLNTSVTLSHVVVALAFVLIPVMAFSLNELHMYHSRPRARQQYLEQIISALPNPRAVIFVRQDSTLTPHYTLIDIRGVPASTPTWVVRDLGDSLNAQLLQDADGRTPYMLMEGTMMMYR